jgi:hypothetical protein
MLLVVVEVSVAIGRCPVKLLSTVEVLKCCLVVLRLSRLFVVPSA